MPGSLNLSIYLGLPHSPNAADSHSWVSPGSQPNGAQNLIGRVGTSSFPQTHIVIGNKS